MNRHDTGSCEILVQRTEQSKIYLPVSREIDSLRSRKLHRALRGDVGSFTDEVQRFDPKILPRVRKAHRALVVQLGVLDIDCKIRQIAVQGPLRGMPQRTSQSNGSGHSRVSS